MKVLIANQNEVTQLLPMSECIEVISDALKMLAGGDAILPLRTMLMLPGGQNLMGLMLSYLGGIETVGVKVIAAFPTNYGTEYDTYQGVVILSTGDYRHLCYQFGGNLVETVVKLGIVH